ncbi:TolC family protein [Flavobacterium sp. '19STA2R22 D10 B1']|uniref:TolC family protein n=1 Tax=Flavobacterium aerium TaxID=3037261 RepID=UPI00278C6CF3|nr:TolC family protein [Flavobacterium sp. '19STA2R22 D10 B1']
MKVKSLLLSVLFVVGISTVNAQDKTPLTLDEAIHIALTKSTEAQLADTKVSTKQYELQAAKNNLYPNLKLSGQYQRLTNADVNFKLGNSDSEGGTTAPKVNQLMLGQASLSYPLFAGLKIQNSIKTSDYLYQAEGFNAAQTKQELAVQVVMGYVNLYKAQQSVALIQENIKSSAQRVNDFTAMEQNGLIARNDLLKAKLQVSNFQVALDEAKKNVSVINFQLITLLKLPTSTQIIPNEGMFDKNMFGNVTTTEQDAIENRSDLGAIRLQQKASETNIKIAKSAYYPSLSLVGGYAAIDLQNVMRVTNAINFGVGLSYDLTSIFKNGKEVKVATSKAQETEHAVELLTDNVKVQVQQAKENYDLSLKQNDVYVEARAQAEENYRIVKDKYENGLSDTNDLLEADVEQLQAKINQAYAKANITQRQYELLAASGKLTQSIK